MTLTILLTLENFPDSLQSGLGTTPLAWLYFLSFMFLVVFTVLNVLIGIVLNAMDEARAEADDRDTKIAQATTVLEEAHQAGALGSSIRQRLRAFLD